MDAHISEDVSTHRPGRQRATLPLRASATAVGSSAVAGIVIACLTLRLNPQIHARPADSLLLITYLGVGYALIGLVMGAAAGFGLLIAQAVARRTQMVEAGHRLESAVLGILGLGPLLFAASLPDLGLAGKALTRLLFSPGLTGKLVFLLVITILLSASGLLLRPAVHALRGRCGLSPDGLLAIGLAAASAAAFVWALMGSPRNDAAPASADSKTLQLPARPLFDDVPPVVLLCIDGADLDDVILPMVQAGDLPTFARLMAEGTWGELESYSPTLSPAIWTTLATGKTKAEHGIHGFTVFHLPGLEASILEFPLHSGLNFQLIPLIEKVPGIPLIRLPFTSDMRRVPALWSIASRYYPVGIYGWRATWPAEQVNGFAIASTVTLAETAHRRGRPSDIDRYRHPPGVLKGLPPAPKLPGFDAVRPYMKPGAAVDPKDENVRVIRSSMSRRTVHYLSHLIRRDQPRFTAAAFYSVDAFNHYFGIAHTTGGRFAPALAERYRFTDARLGELLESLGPDVNVVVTSDHGYDFVNDNHAHAPPGIFFARGPAFQPGRRLETLTVFDVAPLVLHLLALPPAEDLPAVASGSYLAALDSAYVQKHPVSTIPTWGSTTSAALRPRSDGKEKMILEELRSLGYIE